MVIAFRRGELALRVSLYAKSGTVNQLEEDCTDDTPTTPSETALGVMEDALQYRYHTRFTVETETDRQTRTVIGERGM